MEKLNEKMARFVELSKKFSKGEDDIPEVVFINDLANEEIYKHVTLTSGLSSSAIVSNSYLGDRDPYNKPEPRDMDTREAALKTFENKYKVYKEYVEYIELQKALDHYFKAEQLLHE